MHLSTALALAGTASLAAAHPFRNSRRAVPDFPAGISFDILLNKENVDLGNLSGTEAEAFSVIDIDLFDNTPDTIAALHAAGKKVICYFSAGTREDWRDDKDKFQSGDVGKAMEDWEGENWLNVKSDNVKSIMKARIELAASNGCDAVDPDNMDGYNDNQDGWGYEPDAYVAYIKYLAEQAKNNDLAIGLKNSLEIIPDVIDVVQFAVNEQCHAYNECDKYVAFAKANKAVFNIEYASGVCDQPDGVKMTIINKPTDQNLDTLGGLCENNPEPEPESPTPSAAVAAIPSSAAKATSTSANPSSAAKATPTPGTPASSVAIVATASSKISTKTTAATPTPSASGEDEDEEPHHSHHGHQS